MSIPKNAQGKEPTQKELLFSLGTMLFDIREQLKLITQHLKIKENGKDSKN